MMEKIKQTKILIEKIYKVEELIKLFGDVIEDYINQVVLMKDEELKKAIEIGRASCRERV